MLIMLIAVIVLGNILTLVVIRLSTLPCRGRQGRIKLELEELSPGLLGGLG